VAQPPETVFDPYFFYCHVEPEFLVALRCGPGDPSLGDPSGGCHFNASAVSGMILVDHAPIACNGNDLPLDLSQVAVSAPAESNMFSASLDMVRDYATAPIYLRPSSAVAHPRAVFDRRIQP
jgi:hypothetical protein